MAIDGVPKELALALRDAAGVKTFIETGTYKGATAKWAAGEFDKVVTIEWYRPRFRKTKAALSGEYKNVKFCNGDSRTRFQKERKLVKEDAVMLWLDAHWSGNYEQSVGTPGECPLIQELAAVKSNDIVLIDDARLFRNPPPRPHDPEQWPNMRQIRAALPGRYTVIWNDVIISVPLPLAEIVRQHTGHDGGTHYVVATSNDYVGIMPGFAYLFNKFLGPDVKVKVVRYDVRLPGLPANFSQYAVGPQSEYSFTAGLAKFLDWWHYDTLLLMLEDYYLTEIDTNRIQRLQEMMNAGNVDKIDLTGDRSKFRHTAKGDIITSDQNAQYRASLQAAIWRTDYLRDCLSRGDWTPWEFEKHAAQNDGATILGTIEPVMQYINAVGGEGKKPGQFDTKKIPTWLWQELRRARAV